MVNSFCPIFYPVRFILRKVIFLFNSESFTAAHVKDQSVQP